METETVTNLWNKKTSDLTVKDVVVINAAAIITLIGVPVAFGVAGAVKNKIVNKFQKEKVVIKIKTPEEN